MSLKWGQVTQAKGVSEKCQEYRRMSEKCQEYLRLENWVCDQIQKSSEETNRHILKLKGMSFEDEGYDSFFAQAQESLDNTEKYVKWRDMEIWRYEHLDKGQEEAGDHGEEGQEETGDHGEEGREEAGGTDGGKFPREGLARLHLNCGEGMV